MDKVSGVVFSYFVENLFAPGLYTLIAEIVLVRFIQRQATNSCPSAMTGLLLGKFVAFSGPVADKFNAF
ncbi:Uncharacterised protein [Salmonella enterica subsp. arizonae]|uniref:Uncharacterized protein n=1 Tax=Salmonella enterica subsp. arizonae TaxID=59203 RepID=A0A2X4WBX4_SALER|nr:Uncharacterised protein [Salmonella enterica subsp. arizonae]